MSVQHSEASPSSTPSSAFPLPILVAFAVELVFTVGRLGFPKSWIISEKYFLVSTGIWTMSAVLVAMGLGELVRRLPERQAAGARVAMIAYAVSLVLILATGVVNMMTFGENVELFWKVQSYAFCIVALVGTVGIILAAGGFERVVIPAIAVLVITILLSPPPFLGEKLSKLLGSNYRHAYMIGNLLQLALHAFLLREAARSSTRDLPAQPTAPFALLGSSLRARVIAMFVLIGFTLFAVGGRSLGAMKLALIGAPLINLVALIVFAVAALRAARGQEQKLQLAFASAGAASAWCAGVLSLQVPAIYQMLKRDSDSFTSERNTEIAQAFPAVMPLIATLAVVIALVAAASYLRRVGHHEAASTMGPRTTTFVMLMSASVLVQLYVAPKSSSSGQLVAIGLLAGAAGVAGLLVAAASFRSASEATSTTALPTATMMPPD